MHESDLIDQYVRWLENLGKTATHRVGMWASKDLRHRTPLSEGAGVEAVAAIFSSIFNGAKGVKIKVTDRATGKDGHTVYLRWDRLITYENGKTEAYSGVSELMINMDGKIASIIDHWDSVPNGPRLHWFWRLLRK